MPFVHKAPEHTRMKRPGNQSHLARRAHVRYWKMELCKDYHRSTLNNRSPHNNQGRDFGRKWFCFTPYENQDKVSET